MAQSESLVSAAVDEAANLILDKFDYWHPYTIPFRFALAVGQRVSFRNVALTGPVLDIGVNDGSTARIIHHGKGRIAWGGDMPEESTAESCGLYVRPHFNLYDRLIGMDASDIPFPDNSFNTVVSTETFFYGMDRARVLSEIVRVLAPGGTLAFSDSSPEILKFPALAAELKRFIPSFNVPDDPTDYYRRTLATLGMEQVVCRPYFDRSIAALTLQQLYAWPPDSDRDEYARLVQRQDKYRTLHRDGLLALAGSLKTEFLHDEGPEGGWNVFVSGRKAGPLSQRPVPEPCCLHCGARDLDRSFSLCRCASCGHGYQTRFGTPYVLRNAAVAYSPKPADGYTARWVPALEQRIDAALTAFYREAPEALGSSMRVVLVGVDPSTEFTIAHLGQHGIRVDAVCSADSRDVGDEIGRARIVGWRDIDAIRSPLLLSGLGAGQHGDLGRRIRDTGYAGRIFSIGARGVQEIVPPVCASAV